MTPQALQYVINYLNNVIRDQNFYSFLAQNNWNNTGIQHLSNFANDPQNLSQAISNLYMNFKQAANQQAMPQQNMQLLNQQNFNNNNMGFPQQNLGFNNFNQNNVTNDGGFNRHIDTSKSVNEVVQQVPDNFNANQSVNQGVVNEQVKTVEQTPVNNNGPFANNLFKRKHIFELSPTKSYVFNREETGLVTENIATALTSALEYNHNPKHIFVKPVTVLKTRKGLGSKNIINNLIKIDNKTIDNFFIELIQFVNINEKEFSGITEIVIDWINDNFNYVTGDMDSTACIHTFGDIVELREFIDLIPKQDAFKDKIIFNKRLTTLLENIRNLYFNFDNGATEIAAGQELLVDYDKDILVTRVSGKLYYINDIEPDMVASIVNDVYRNNELFCFLASQDDVSEITINKDREGKLKSYTVRQVYRI